MVWTAGCTATEVTPTASLYVTPAGVFGADGIAVCYHSNNAFFKTPNVTGTTAADGTPANQITFVNATYANGGVTYSVDKGT